MDLVHTLSLIRETASPLKKQLLTAAVICELMRIRGSVQPVVIGGVALAYYSREVYATADIDLACADRESLDHVLCAIGFERQGRYWISSDLGLAVEAPASGLPGEDAPLEIVELGDGLSCRILGIEDLVIDRLNACVHWTSRVDCEAVELLLRRYGADIDWGYLRRKAAEPANNTTAVLDELRGRIGS